MATTSPSPPVVTVVPGEDLETAERHQCRCLCRRCCHIRVACIVLLALEVPEMIVYISWGASFLASGKVAALFGKEAQNFTLTSQNFTGAEADGTKAEMQAEIDRILVAVKFAGAALLLGAFVLFVGIICNIVAIWKIKPMLVLLHIASLLVRIIGAVQLLFLQIALLISAGKLDEIIRKTGTRLNMNDETMEWIVECVDYIYVIVVPVIILLLVYIGLKTRFVLLFVQLKRYLTKKAKEMSPKENVELRAAAPR